MPHEAFTLQAGRTTGWKSFAPPTAHNFCKRFRNALTTAQATIVLPAFARSFFADGKKNYRDEPNATKLMRPSQKAGSTGNAIAET
ncbi:hypothetical protein D0C36_24250 [Mucilaginibacter conchicola]|uniref:Uncharacterized protein n=1 Tax=Mucilaginibacter conchicola TaxID=2303333 RepID=A0A372NLP7_9SPHI|nr:hypothetical protein [Mucilaginibacter conchicola]RFZ89886.1 hypothetical protein D0C36_24250 [Mucilaginibacter conchicola]